MVDMKIDELLFEYGESHQNPKNIAIHKICVPLITFSVIGLLYAIDFHIFSVRLVYLLAALACIYYGILSVKYLFMFLPFLFLFLYISVLLNSAGVLLEACVSVFVLAWIGQFYGHAVEGKKPSFLKDVQFLLIGPLWTIKTVFKLS